MFLSLSCTTCGLCHLSTTFYVESYEFKGIIIKGSCILCKVFNKKKNSSHLSFSHLVFSSPFFFKQREAIFFVILSLKSLPLHLVLPFFFFNKVVLPQKTGFLICFYRCLVQHVVCVILVRRFSFRHLVSTLSQNRFKVIKSNHDRQYAVKLESYIL